MPIRINILAEQQALEEMRRRDPVKRTIWIGVILVAAMLAWSLSLLAQAMENKSKLTKFEFDLNSKTNEYKLILGNKKKLEDIKFKLVALDRLTTNRFLVGNLLNAVQQSTITDVQLIRFKLDQSQLLTEAVKAEKDKPNSAKPAKSTEKTMLTLDAKDSNQDAGSAISKYQEKLSGLEYFLNMGSKPLEFKLTRRGTPQSDVDGKLTVVFTVECHFPDKTR